MIIKMIKSIIIALLFTYDGGDLHIRPGSSRGTS